MPQGIGADDLGVDRRAAVVVIHGSDEKVALESFAEWIRSGRRIGCGRWRDWKIRIQAARRPVNGLAQDAPATVEMRQAQLAAWQRALAVLAHVPHGLAAVP